MNLQIAFTDEGWADYLSWQKDDKNRLKKINKLIEDVRREPFSGIGKPEPLKGNLAGFWSHRINLEHRLVYTVADDFLIIIQCRFHY